MKNGLAADNIQEEDGGVASAGKVIRTGIAVSIFSGNVIRWETSVSIFSGNIIR